MGEVTDLRTLSSMLMDRYAFAKLHGLSFGGARDLYAALGYDRILSNQSYRERFKRDGIANRIVKTFPKATWRGGVECIEDEDPTTDTQFEKDCDELNKKVKLWARLQQVDILAQLGKYAVLLIGAGDDLSAELPKGRPGGVLYLTPFAEDDAKIQEYVTDATDSRFGLPKTYTLKRIDIASPQFTKPVHFSRIIHVADGLLDDDINGEPCLESINNLLDDLAKVSGGGAEAFFQRANQGMQLNLDKDATLSTEAQDKLKAEVEEYRHNVSRVLKTKGMEVNMLGSDVANFSNPIDGIITLIAGAKGIPKRILTGSEQGELASSQDRSTWAETIKDRRTSYAEPCIVRPLIDRLIEYGYLTQPKEYNVRWPEMENLTQQERATMAKALADVNASQGSIVVTSDEIRDWALAKEPLTDEQKAAAEPPQPEVVPGASTTAVPAASGKGPEANPKPFPRAAGGAGSGWTAENGHVPGAIAKASDASAHPDGSWGKGSKLWKVTVIDDNDTEHTLKIRADDKMDAVTYSRSEPEYGALEYAGAEPWPKDEARGAEALDEPTLEALEAALATGDEAALAELLG
jgi:hypothetical protein